MLSANTVTASFNEKLLLSNGLSISPIKGPGDATGQPRSLRDAVLSISNEKDLNDFLLTQYSRMPPNKGEPRYERHPVSCARLQMLRCRTAREGSPADTTMIGA